MHSETASQRRIGRYVLLDRLGRGAMGVVYRAQDPLINRTVAVKLLDILQTLSPEQTAVVHERFMREAQTAGNLDHPNIVKIYDVGRDDETGDFYIVMEYLPGQSLERKLEDGPVGALETLELVRALASALDAAHARGIVHRDIKPANILFTDDRLAKITDFGIARITTSHLTQDVRDLGTPVFMSPEQVSGRPLDGRADLFSLGIVTYQMLAGAPPFDGKNAVSLAYQIVHSSPPSLREAVPALPARIDEIMGKILAKDPIQRYATGKAFVDALAEVLDPPRAAAPRVPTRAVPSSEPSSAPRRPALAVLGGGVLLLGIGGLLLGRAWVGRNSRHATAPLPSRVESPVVPTVPAPIVAPAPANPAPPAKIAKEAKNPPAQVRTPKVTAPVHAPPPVGPAEPTGVAAMAPPPEVKPEPAPARPSAPVAVEPAHLAISLGHWISRGTLTVYADGAPILTREFSKKKIVPFQTSVWDSVDVPPGARELTARVVTPKGETFEAESYAIELAAGERVVLRLGLRNETLSFKSPGS